MYRIAISAVLLAFAASSNAQPAGLGLNLAAERLASDLPVLGDLLTSKGPTLPILGDLPGLNLVFGERVFLLGNANLADLLNAVDVGASGNEFATVLTGQLQRSGGGLLPGLE